MTESQQQHMVENNKSDRRKHTTIDDDVIIVTTYTGKNKLNCQKSQKKARHTSTVITCAVQTVIRQIAEMQIYRK